MVSAFTGRLPIWVWTCLCIVTSMLEIDAQGVNYAVMMDPHVKQECMLQTEGAAVTCKA